MAAPEFSRLVYLSAVHCKGLQEYAPTRSRQTQPTHSPPPTFANFARSSVGTAMALSTKAYPPALALTPSRDGDCGLVQHVCTQHRLVARRAQKPGLGPRTLRRVDGAHPPRHMRR
jgi:hypothetical protein